MNQPWTNAVLMFGVSGWKEQIEDSMLLDSNKQQTSSWNFVCTTFLWREKLMLLLLSTVNQKSSRY